VSRLSKTASTAIAALVVSGAAAVAPFVGPSAAGGAPPASSASPPASFSAAGRGPDGAGSAPAEEASALPATGADPPPGGRRVVLFLGGGPELRPRGGTTASFACLAADALERRCAVSLRVPPAAKLAALRPDVVVLAMTPQDDASSLGAVLDALPPALRDVRTVVLAPVQVTRSAAVTAHLAGIRALAAGRGTDLVDPVALHWVTPATRSVYLTADGVRPTAAGAAYLGERLALALTSLGA